MMELLTRFLGFINKNQARERCPGCFQTYGLGGASDRDYACSSHISFVVVT